LNFLLQKKIGEQLSQRTGFGNTVVDRHRKCRRQRQARSGLISVEDPTKRSDHVERDQGAALKPDIDAQTRPECWPGRDVPWVTR
jgi:hypothetical protein